MRMYQCILVLLKLKTPIVKKLLGIKVDSRLNFNEHLDGIINKASRKINALSTITPFVNKRKRRILMNSFFNTHFKYCPLELLMNKGVYSSLVHSYSS